MARRALAWVEGQSTESVNVPTGPAGFLADIAGVLPPGAKIEPAWLAYPVGTGLWDKPVPRDTNGACLSDPCTLLWIRVDPSSGLTFDTAGRWVRISGHFRDPAAETCKYIISSFEPINPGATDDGARQTCRAAFVLTAVESAPPPL